MTRTGGSAFKTLTIGLVVVGALTLSIWLIDRGEADAASLKSTADPSLDTRSQVSQGDPAGEGELIWGRDCAVCHGTRGQGSFQGPRIAESGTAAVSFMVRTGRMPLAIDQTSDGLFSSLSGRDSERSKPKYGETQIERLVDYTGTFISGHEATGPVDIDSANLAKGGELYRQQCSACHQMAGSGGALAYGTVGPSLHSATPEEVVDAIRTGPGSMPVFPPSVLDDSETTDVAAYVNYLKDPNDRGGFALWHLGPVPEGLVAWVVGLGLIVVMCRWLGDQASSPSEEHSTDEPSTDEPSTQA